METFVGIDVAKKVLDLFIRPTGERLQVGNNPEGIAALIERVRVLSPSLIVCESTGGYERDATFSLYEAGFPIVVVNARQIRDFAKATNMLAKTDNLDAEVIALFAERLRPQLRKLDPSLRELDEKLLRRRQLVEMRAQEKNRVQQARGPIKRGIERMIRVLSDEIAALEDDIDNELRGRMEAELNLLLSVPGVGPGVARTMLIELPELGQLPSRKLSALAGLAPFNDDSGTMRGQRHIRGGRAVVRTALYQAAVVGIRHNPAIARVWHRLRHTRNLPPKVAIIACARKLLSILNAIIRNRQPWNPTLVPTTP